MIYIYYIVILNLPFVILKYIIDMYSKIRCETNNNDQVLKFLRIFKNKNKNKNKIKIK